jgi:hypothetical protein
MSLVSVILDIVVTVPISGRPRRRCTEKRANTGCGAGQRKGAHESPPIRCHLNGIHLIRSVSVHS